MTIENVPGALRGYSLRRLDDLAAYAVRSHLKWWAGHDRADQKQAAWDSITEHLLTAGEQPTERDLIRAGERGINALARNEKRHHGIPHNHLATGERFASYWEWAARCTPSPEESVTDRLAVPQILARLSARQLEAVRALAAYGDYQSAAASMGVSYELFHRHLTDARKRFLSLWLEGETPAKVMWRQDRRASREILTDEQICGSQSGYNRHRNHGQEPCERCRDANNAASRARYARRKAALAERAA